MIKLQNASAIGTFPSASNFCNLFTNPSGNCSPITWSIEEENLQKKEDIINVETCECNVVNKYRYDATNVSKEIKRKSKGMHSTHEKRLREYLIEGK